MLCTIDIEGALVDSLKGSGYSASAPPVPSTLGSSLPHVHVTRTGGMEANAVCDMHYVDFDVYARNDAEAMGAACALTGDVRALAGAFLGGVPCYGAEIVGMPTGNHDPDRPNLSRATFQANILTRMAGA